MLQKIPHSAFTGQGPIQMLYPGLQLSNADSGIGSIGRIDHANFRWTHLIPMHPHVNDEILSYFKTGKVGHTDSEQFKATIGGQRLMLMKAGRQFFHEEYIDGRSEPFEGLQIFIRPAEKDLKPAVIIQDLEERDSLDKWRLIASPTPQTTLRFSSQTWIFDVKLSGGKTIGLPELPGKDLTALLYVYQGEVGIDQKISLEKKDSLVFRNEDISIHALQDADMVLFFADENAPIFKDGMYSGNR